MKILHVIASVDPRDGGPIDSINTISAVWRRQGHTVRIASLDEAAAPWTGTSSFEVFALGSALFRSLPGGGYGYSPFFARRLRRLAMEADVVVEHGLWNYASIGCWRALRRSATPYFVFAHGMLDPWFIEAFPRKAKLKSIYWRALEHRVLRDAAGVFFTAQEERNLAAQSFKPYVARPFVVGLGTGDPTGEPARQRQAFADHMPQLQGRRFVLFLSRIHPKKGIDLLIRAFARQAPLSQDLDLVIAGPDQVGLQHELQALAERLGIAGRVHWPGMITGDAKWGAFRASEFFALSSHQENFGIAVAEALAVGTPVLITNKINIWREIEQDGAGLVAADDAESVSTAFAQLCAATDEERAQMSIRARQCFQRRYDIEAVASGIVDLFETQLAARPSSRR